MTTHETKNPASIVPPPRFSSLSGPFGLSLPPSSCRPKGPVRSRTGPAPPGMVKSEGESREASTEGDTRPRSRDMEEEIIGNRWKELDYDGYCLSLSLLLLVGSLVSRVRQ